MGKRLLATLVLAAGLICIGLALVREAAPAVASEAMPALGIAELYAQQERYADQADRIVPVWGDLTKPKLGVKADQIAEAQGIPAKFLETILLEPKHAGIVRSQRGPDGGYALARPAEDIEFFRRTFEFSSSLEKRDDDNIFGACELNRFSRYGFDHDCLREIK